MRPRLYAVARSARWAWRITLGFTCTARICTCTPGGLQPSADRLQLFVEGLRVQVCILEVYAEDLQPYANDLLMLGEGLRTYVVRS